MTTSYSISSNDQLYVNNKWYFDVKAIDGDIIKVRIKYYENSQKDFYIYKVIKLPLNIFKNPVKDNFIVRCTVIDRELKLQIGGLINRLVTEPDILQLAEGLKTNEDMGAVSNPGLSGTAGQIGSFGSGDIASHPTTGSSKLLPKGEFGLQIVSKKNRKHIAQTSKKQHGVLLKTPILHLQKENVDATNTNTDNDYKNSVYTFLDYPTDNEYDGQLIDMMSQHRAELINISAERVIQYVKDLYNTNRAFIRNKCSEWFQNNIAILAKL